VPTSAAATATVAHSLDSLLWFDPTELMYSLTRKQNFRSKQINPALQTLVLPQYRPGQSGVGLNVD
jgi:hypothetical protein